MNKYEVLAPAGSYECMLAAFNAGADAVYVGGQMFGARAFANNFSTEELIQAIDFAHLHGKKIFLTVNTLLKNQEIEQQLVKYLIPLYEAGLDAVIVQDFGVLSLIKKHFPLMDIHASTQMTVTGKYFAKDLKKLGVSRIVPARELSLKEISEIYNETSLEIECFVHGALCYSYSGLCLLSSLIGARSGNRGRCAQPCRLPYDTLFKDETINGQYPLSPKDLCTLKILPKILEAGVYSLKIEGRMKKPEYVASVTAMYRKYVDMYIEKGSAGYKVDEKDIKLLMDIYNRGGFTEGYYEKHNGRELMSLERPNHMGVKVANILSVDKNKRIITAKAVEDISKDDILEIFVSKDQNVYVTTENISKNCDFTIKFNNITSGKNERIDINKVVKLIGKGTSIMRTRNNLLVKDIQDKYVIKSNIQDISFCGQIFIKKASPITVNIWYKDLFINVTGTIPENAANRPVSAEDIYKQFNKTGGTGFVLDKESFDIVLDDGLFVNIKELNQLRRDALEQLKAGILEKYKCNYTEINENIGTNIQASTYNAPLISVLVSSAEQLNEVINTANVSLIYVEKHIFSDDSEELWQEYIKKAHSKDKKILLAMPYITRSLGKEYIFRNKDTLFKLDFDGYLFRNMETVSIFEELKIDKKYTVFDNTIYGLNNHSFEYLCKYKPDLLTASYELNKQELLHIQNPKMELCVYGYIPVMISAGCLKKSYNKCNKQSEIVYLNDRLNNKFMVINRCEFCYNVVYNSKPLYLCDIINENNSFNAKALRYNFVNESPSDIRNILSGASVKEYTRGHYKRGVE